MDKRTACERLDRVVAAFQGKERFLVQTHNNPDPDSIACAMALRYLVQRYTGREAVIAFGGVVGRSENRAMVRQLQVPLVPGSLVDYSAYDFTAVCDTQPGTNYTSFPDGFVPTVVIDHHALRPETKASPVYIVEPSYGATSTLVGEMLLAKGIPIPTDVATALFYGIRSETQDLARDTTEADVTVYRELEKLIDRRVLARIESERVPREYFRETLSAIRNARLHERVVVADLGQVRVPDMVPEMADFLLRLEGMHWSCVLGEYQETLYVSLRTTDPAANAGELIRRVVAGMGSAGGHASMAGGQVPMNSFTSEEKEGVKRTFVEEMLREAGVEDLEGVPLVPPRQAE
jgi:nanoRNase/pAp phosphatase (c-di-AMP/oligoRNAs hydrolase)